MAQGWHKDGTWVTRLAQVLAQVLAQGWRSGEGTRLPPMRPGFKSRRRRQMWIEFVVGSLLYSEGFFPGFSPLLINQHFQIQIRPGVR